MGKVDHQTGGSAPRPFEEILAQIPPMLGRHDILLLTAQPGAGKTTTIPLVVRDLPMLNKKKVLVVEPRRVAAIGAADYIASRLGERAGESVGYRTRAASRVGQYTTLEFVTEGILTRMLLNDPSLEEYGAIIFDEFHERSIDSDVALAFTLQARESLRPDLKIIVMSATLETKGLLTLLPDAVALNAEGRLHPVSIVYAPPERNTRFEDEVARTVRRAAGETSGDILVFLPGAREIRAVADRFKSQEASREYSILSLSSETPLDEQKRILRGGSEGERRVILSTNLAETSVTITGVRVVIDSGLMRISQINHARGMSELVTVSVSRASATQRAGRAGRQGPGHCYRMWSEYEHRALQEYNQPEILRAELSPFLLDCAAWGVRSPKELKLLDVPQEAALSEAGSLLRRLGAIDETGRITAFGKRMSDLGVHPRLAAMVLAAESEGLVGDACDLAALLEERDPLGRTEDRSVHARWQALADYRSGRANVSRGEGVLSRIARSAERLRERMRQPNAEAFGDRIGFLLGLAYPDRIAKRRAKGAEAYLLSNGGGAVLSQGDLLARHEYLTVAELSGSGANAKVFLAEPLSESDLNALASRLGETVESVAWDARRECAVSATEVRIGAIPIERRPRPVSEENALSLLFEELTRAGLGILSWGREAALFRERILWARARRPEQNLPDVSDDALLQRAEEWLFPYAPGAKSFSDLRRVDLSAALSTLLTHQQKIWLDEFAPSCLDLVTGTKAWISYQEPPSIAVALQEMFGTKETPRIADGSVPLTIELLSPAKRPLQVTKDLASFWKNTYPKLRVEMRASYPKHSWPENPLDAVPTRGPRRRK